MAMQKVCDRCGKAIGTGLFPRPLIRKGLIDRSYDLCYDCYAEFDEWMEGKKYEPKTENEDNETGAGVV